MGDGRLVRRYIETNAKLRSSRQRRRAVPSARNSSGHPSRAYWKTIGSGGTARIGLLREGPFERVDEAEFDRHALVGERIAERSELVALRARARPADPRYDRPLDAVESGQSIAVLRCRRSNSTDCIRHPRRRAPISYSRLRPHQTACSASFGSATAISPAATRRQRTAWSDASANSGGRA